MQTRHELVLMFMLALTTSQGNSWTAARIYSEAGLLADEYLANS